MYVSASKLRFSSFRFFLENIYVVENRNLSIADFQVLVSVKGRFIPRRVKVYCLLCAGFAGLLFEGTSTSLSIECLFSPLDEPAAQEFVVLVALKFVVLR